VFDGEFTAGSSRFAGFGFVERRVATPLKEGRPCFIKINRRNRKMPSCEASRRNLVIARSRWRRPKPWRSQRESRVIRLYVWQWLLGHGPWCSGRALAGWLGISHTYVQTLVRSMPRDENIFLREIAHSEPPSVESLRCARAESRHYRERGLLRSQPRWKAVEYRIGSTILRDVVPTKPNAATTAANNPFVPNAPGPTNPERAKPNYNAMYIWNLRVNAARSNSTEPWQQPGRRRWR
jgi:hypothetical protein